MSSVQTDRVLHEAVKVIRAALYIPNEPISADTHLVNDLDLDSLDLITVFLDIEDEFGIEFPDDGPARLVRVGDLVRYLNQCVAGVGANGPSSSETALAA